MFNLEWLLSPMSVDKFKTEYWQQRASIIATGRPDYFEKIFNFHEFELAMEYGQPQPPSIRLASSSQAHEPISVPTGQDGRLDIDCIRRHFAEGYTVIINNLQDFNPGVASLVQALQEQMSYPVEANSYLTPPGAQGFKSHYDTHDVIVAQVEGEKLWRVYGQEVSCPLTELTNGDPYRRESLPSPEHFSLKPGDVLYIPRGWVHEAETDEGGSSLHLTFGVHMPTGRDLVRAAVDALCRVHPEFRQPLPMGFLHKPVPTDELSHTLHHLTDLLKADGSVEEAIGSIEDEFIRRGRSAGDGQFVKSVDAMQHLGIKDKLERRHHLHARLVNTETGVGLQFGQSLIEAPNHYKEAMEFLLNVQIPFSVDRLPGLDKKQKISLAVTLLRDGLVRLVQIE